MTRDDVITEIARAMALDEEHFADDELQWQQWMGSATVAVETLERLGLLEVAGDQMARLEGALSASHTVT